LAQWPGSKGKTMNKYSVEFLDRKKLFSSMQLTQEKQFLLQQANGFIVPAKHQETLTGKTCLSLGCINATLKQGQR
jgi:hypothetical protein